MGKSEKAKRYQKHRVRVERREQTRRRSNNERFWRAREKALTTLDDSRTTSAHKLGHLSPEEGGDGSEGWGEKRKRVSGRRAEIGRDETLLNSPVVLGIPASEDGRKNDVDELLDVGVKRSRLKGTKESG